MENEKPAWGIQSKFLNDVFVMPSVIYSIAMPLNRGGMGTIAWHACRGLDQAGLLRATLAPETDAAGMLGPRARALPWVFQKTMRVMNRLGWHRVKDDFFDRWASRWIEPGMDYYGWMHQSLACIRKCHRGAGRAWVDRGSVEPQLQRRWLVDEYARFGLKRDPMHPQTVERMVREADEADAIVAPSTLVADSYRAAGYRPCKLLVNPLGVDLVPVADDPPQDKIGVLRVAFVGQLSIQKGVPDLLRAWQKLRPRAAELVLAGIIPDDERSVIKPLLAETPAVVWKGHCADVPALLRTCDALVLPSAQDGFGMVVLEAFAAGRAVLVSDRVGAQDCVTEGKDGSIFRFGDQRAFAEKLEWLLQDRARLQQMGQAARATAARHTWKAYGERLATFIQHAA